MKMKPVHEEKKEMSKGDKLVAVIKQVEANDLVFALGFLLILAGFFWLYPPLSLIISGTILSAISLKGLNIGDS